MGKMVKYPIGEQSFESLRKGGFLYVDKSRFIENIIQGSKYYFLGRPRRFGKSLFLSMLKCFFESKRELFSGLYADTMEWDWDTYPVLMLDLNIEKYKSRDALHEVVGNCLRQWEERYDVIPSSDSLSVRFSNVIRAAYEKTGRQVVILVDEYDKPLVNNLHDREQFEYYRDSLATIYSNFKSSADYIRLVFLTGVSRFGKLSVFSGLNNISDISFDNKFSAVCGITEDELLNSFSEGIKGISEDLGMTEEKVKAELKKRYDGYRFTPFGKDIYNPFSILQVMAKSFFRNYWIESGTPSLLVELLKKTHVDIDRVVNVKCELSDLSGLNLDNINLPALFYQTGYLTIKDYDLDTELATLGLPNNEVKKGLFSYILPYYINIDNQSPRFYIVEFVNELREGKAESFMKRLQSMFSSVSYQMEMEREQNLHNALYILMVLVGLDVQTEMETSEGRIDLFVRTDRYYYIIELKLDGTAEEALSQIEDRRYDLPFAVDNREIIKIGVNFSSKTRTLEEWIVKFKS